MNSIILIGYRGVGKSAVSSALSETLKLEKVSVDDELRNKLGNLQDFIKLNGWTSFRNEEYNVVLDLSLKDNLNIVLDTGGGIVETEEAMNILKKMGQIFWLSGSVDVIKERLLISNPRLSLSGNGSYLDEISAVLEKRTPLYKKYCDYVIDTDGKSIDEIVAEVIKKSRI